MRKNQSSTVDAPASPITKERPILFSGPMVRAILEDRKTKTRRVLNPQPFLQNLRDLEPADKDGIPYWCIDRLDPEKRWAWLPGERPNVPAQLCPYGKPGDRLWVRETWAAPVVWNATPPRDLDPHVGCWWLADDKRPLSADELRWRPSIHMPRWASRITLEITGVRVERLQEISHGDAMAEGCAGYDWVPSSPYIVGPHTDAGELPQEEFQRLWDSINGKREGCSWSDNPWAWVVSFRRFEVAK